MTVYPIAWLAIVCASLYLRINAAQSLLEVLEVVKDVKLTVL